MSAGKQPSWKRSVDLVLSVLLSLIACPIFLICWIAVRLTSRGPAIYWSRRIGKDNQIFLMPKFRTMKINTPQLATHLLQDSEKYITSIGRLLRKTSLDELPQLLSVLKGDLSLVGPRPALFNQYDLVELRTKAGVHHLVPGITGWAQVNGRDDLEIPRKVSFDAEYLQTQSLGFDLKILWLTVFRVVKAEGVQH